MDRHTFVAWLLRLCASFVLFSFGSFWIFSPLFSQVEFHTAVHQMTSFVCHFCDHCLLVFFFPVRTKWTAVFSSFLRTSSTCLFCTLDISVSTFFSEYVRSLLLFSTVFRLRVPFESLPFRRHVDLVSVQPSSFVFGFSSWNFPFFQVANASNRPRARYPFSHFCAIFLYFFGHLR